MPRRALGVKFEGERPTGQTRTGFSHVLEDIQKRRRSWQDIKK
jgi:hypothetical protein